VKDLLGRPMTDSERRILAAYRSLRTVLQQPGLPPNAAANVKEAVASLWQVVRGLALRGERPEGPLS
jgi:hypothetical protein